MFPANNFVKYNETIHTSTSRSHCMKTNTFFNLSESIFAYSMSMLSPVFFNKNCSNTIDPRIPAEGTHLTHESFVKQSLHSIKYSVEVASDVKPEIGTSRNGEFSDVKSSFWYFYQDRDSELFRPKNALR